MSLDPFDGNLVERSTHGEESQLGSRVLELPELRFGKRGLGEPLDVLQVGSRAVVRMDEAVQVAVLQLEGEAEAGIKTFARFADLAKDAQAVFEAAHVVVGHLEDEQGNIVLLVHRSPRVESVGSIAVTPMGR